MNHFVKLHWLYTCADIAVGAPFDGDGKVFIYRGSDAGIETKPAQVSLISIQHCSQKPMENNERQAKPFLKFY